MKIYFPNALRMMSFRVLVDGSECYVREGSGQPSSPITITCGRPVFGQNVTIELKKNEYEQRILNLCEVEIYGNCRNGSFGQDCEQSCNCGNESEICNKTTGQCNSGCAAGYNGVGCQNAHVTDCKDGWFGPDCRQECKCKDIHEVCNKTTGQCVYSGCEDGWTGLDCYTECKNGTYGFNCSHLCGRCFGGVTCGKIEGECAPGCEKGFTEPLCQSCSDLYYGADCKRCGQCRGKMTCDRDTGRCPDGCLAGWRGEKCQKECVDGYYGQNCSQRCGHCHSGAMCNKTDGKCRKGCEDGFLPPLCQECRDSFYGLNCSKTCDQCSEGTFCDKEDGVCPTGCRPGWKGRTCSQKCSDGFYGLNCSNTCGNCSEGTFCDKDDGECPAGCRPGWKGQTCSQSCNGTGKYGYNCNETCGWCVEEEECEAETGHCPRGCAPMYEGVTCQIKNSSTSDTMTAGMGVFYFFICILAVGLMVAVYFLKRRQQKTTNEESVAMTSSRDSSHSNNQEAGPSSSASTSAEHAMQNDENEYMNVEQTKVKVSELRQYIARRTDKFEFEYTRLSKGLQYPHSVAANQANKGKNRFKAIYPYDHSRVVLQQTPGIKQSDYINASYIDTYKEKKFYIATQGPSPLTVGDFWRMVWQEKSPILVMLTRLAEGIKVKCEQYWPDEGKPMTHGDLQITTEAFVQKADYVIRELTVHNRKLNQKHPVTQLHYVTWPDHDVPSAPALVRFWKVFRSMAALNKKPFIVHCSAGVGRTGTFIGLDVLVQRARDVGMVDVYDYVKMMREDRVSMVQTKEQYLFLHQVILEALYSDRTSMTPTTFEALFPTDTLGSASEQSALQEQWKNLQELNRVLHDKDVTASLLPENIRKTRVKDVLPADKHRPILALPVPETNDYINAVFVPSDSNEKGLVATQLPLPWTVVDFWRLVIDHNIRTVINLDPNVSGRKADDEAPFWPQTSTEMNSDPFVVSKIETKNKQTTSVSLQVWQKESAESTKHDVQLLYMSDWPMSQDTPTQTSDFMHLLNEVNMLEKADSGSVAVMCRDGATRCGLFCAVFNIIQRLKADNDIDIYLIIRQLKTIRPSFIPSYGQFQFCYQMVKEFQKTVNSVYENFQPSCQ